MKRNYLAVLLMLPLLMFSQNEREKIQGYLNTNLSGLNLTQKDASDWVIQSKATSKSTKITNYYINQRYNGIEIFNALSNVWIKDNNVIHMGNRFVSNCAQKVNTTVPQIGVLEALHQAVSQLEVNSGHNYKIITAIDTRSFIISNVDKADNIRAKLVFQSTSDKKLILAWDFYIDVPKQNHMWSVRVNAVNGQIIDKNDLVVSCNFGEINHENCTAFHFNKVGFKQESSLLETQSGAYRVVPFTTESPNHGPIQLISNPDNAVASPFGWHDIDGVAGAEFTSTRGNNVHAFEDLDDDDDPDLGFSPDGGAGLTFDFPYLGINTPAINYLEAATTNLFYMNNIIHDVFYQYGFDEENGNFQMNNYGHSGDGNDFVLAQAQDGGGINNANFATPPDGGNGRMQMYLWTRKAGADLITINAPASIAGTYTAFDNGFFFGHVDLPTAPATLTTNLVLVDDGDGDTSDGCTTLVNAADVNGKIAVIRRGGSCSTNIKILNAQDAGAIAVILISNLPGNYFLGGTGNDAITIPVISVKKDVGDFLIAEMATNTLNASLSEPISDFVNVDGDFDNLIIAHEYGHGISNRLTGGSSAAFCLFNDEQMGEGWSDWFGLMLQMKAADNGGERRGIGTFAINQPIDDDGIRSYPYSTDTSVNPLTFADTNTQARPHGVGSVWATILWDLSWAYVDKYGFDPNVYNGNGGNNKVLQLVVDGLKLQPCEPSFVDGRDAIIAADQATTGGQDFCMIWEVFARRGLGLNASSGDNDNSTDQIEDFSVPPPGPNCSLKIDYFQNDVVSVFPNPTSDDVTIKINNYSGSLEIQLFDLNGRIILEKTIDSFSIEEQISLKGLSSGIYLLKLNGENISSTKKLIVN